jgi:glycolate oxidase
MIKDTPEDRHKAEEAVRDIFAETVRLGGTLSGEHGIGTSKSAYLDMELSPEVITAMKSIKTLFDPNNILNPGKIFR